MGPHGTVSHMYSLHLIVKLKEKTRQRRGKNASSDMTFLNFKFWKQIGISDTRVSSLAFINGGKNPQASTGNLYSRSQPPPVQRL